MTLKHLILSIVYIVLPTHGSAQTTCPSSYTIKRNLNDIKNICSSLELSAATSSKSQKLSPTIYYSPIVDLDLEKCPKHTDLKDGNGKRLITVCEKQAEACTLEGSCHFRVSGEVKSFSILGNKTFMRSEKKCPFGHGVQSGCLDPYHSVAADSRFYPYGSVIFIPELKGQRLPNGEIHDGYLIVRDVGGNIKGANRFDFFTGFETAQSRENPFNSLGFGDKNIKKVFYKVSEDVAKQVRQKRNFPGLPQTQ